MAATLVDEKNIKSDSSSIVDEKADYASITNDGDKIIEGSEGVTEHEFKTLRHVADTLPYTAWLVVIVEFAERYVT